MALKIENAIFHGLLTNEEYAKKVIPFIDEDMFDSEAEKLVFSRISNFVDNYQDIPNGKTMIIDINELEVTENVYKEALSLIKRVDIKTNFKLDWMVDKTEQWGKDKKLYNAMSFGVSTMGDKNSSKVEILERIKEALSYSFDSSIGHDYLEDALPRHEYYHKEEHKVSFDLDKFNKVTNGGFSRGTLNVLQAGTNTGKSLVMAHMAAANLSAGYNVLYISLEMGEEETAQRIDSNLLDIPMDDILNLRETDFMSRMEKMKSKVSGNIIIKQYPPATVHAGHFRSLINDLNLKKGFVPDIVYVDYVNLCASMRSKDVSNTNSYLKFVSEELRALAIEFDYVCVTATQTNRAGMGEDFDLTETAESISIPMTADFQAGIISDEKLASLGQYKIKILKSRYGNKTKMPFFYIGVDYEKMRLYDVNV